MYNGMGRYPFAVNSNYWSAAWQTLQARHGKKFMTRFWSAYSSKTAHENRIKTLTSNAKQKQEVDKIINLVYVLHCIEKGYSETGQNDFTQAEAIQKVLGDYLKKCVLNSDGKGTANLRNLANAVGVIDKNTADPKNHDSAATAQSKLTLKERLLKGFCDLLVEKKAIPSRTELEVQIGVSRQVDCGEANSKNVATALRALGLEMLIE